jgi:translation elongation factor EF-1alpha
MTIVESLDTATRGVLVRAPARLRRHEAGRVVLRLQEPLLIEPWSGSPVLGRFVIESWERICGVGVVRDQV